MRVRRARKKTANHIVNFLHLVLDLFEVLFDSSQLAINLLAVLRAIHKPHLSANSASVRSAGSLICISFWALAYALTPALKFWSANLAGMLVQESGEQVMNIHLHKVLPSALVPSKSQEIKTGVSSSLANNSVTPSFLYPVATRTAFESSILTIAHLRVFVLIAAKASITYSYTLQTETIFSLFFLNFNK